MKKLFCILAFLMTTSAWAQNPSPPVTGQITAATTNATCVGGVQVGGAVDQPINGATGAVGISVTGTWSATLNIQFSVDHGKTWTASGGTFTANQQSVITTTANSDVCVFASAYTSGTAIVTFATGNGVPGGSGGSGASATQVQGTAASGSAAVGNPVVIAGTNGTTVHTANMDGNGNQLVNIGGNNATPAGMQTTAQTQGVLFGSLNGTQGALGVATVGPDPCLTTAVPKTSIPINITTATTTSLVAVSGSTKIYVCGGTLTISQVVTTANTFLLEYGTGAACATTQSVQTGTYGGGGVTAGSPISIIIPEIGPSAASSALCAVTTIGATGSFQGVLTYVQQ